MKHRRIDFCFASILMSALFAGSLAMMPAAPTMAAPFAYVVGGALSGGVPEIAVIDANPTSATFNTVIATIPNTSLAINLAITPDGSRGYVLNNDGTVSVIDTSPSSTTFNTVVATITPPGGAPFFGLATAVAIMPNGSRAYTGSRWDPVSGDAFVAVIDTVPTSPTYNTVLANIDTGFHESTNAIAVTPDGSRAYMTGEHTLTLNPAPVPSCNNVPCVYGNAIEVVDTTTNGLSAFLTPSVNCTTDVIAITPDGSRAYVMDGCQLNVVNLSNNTVVATIPMPGFGVGPVLGLAITPDGNHAYVSASNQTDGLVLVVDTNPSSSTYNTVVTTINLGPQISSDPAGIAVTPDGALVYLAGINPSNSTPPGFIDVIATASNTIVAEINLSARASAVAITPAPAFSGGQLVFAPKSWDFGAIKVGTTAIRKLNIANGSQTQALQVNVLQATPNPPYSLLSGGGFATIGAGQSEQIVVQFKPVAATATPIAGSIPITSSDPNRPSASIPLSGRGK
jgi:DNA-binding beta-propeller fold protein YncE